MNTAVNRIRLGLRGKSGKQGILIPLFFLAFCFLSTVSLAQESVNHGLKDKSIGIAFPPVKNREQIVYSHNKLKELSVKRIRFAENWKYREPQKNRYVWKPLDYRIDYFSRNNIEFLLTIQSDGPDWVKKTSSAHNGQSLAFTEANNADFAVYLKHLLQRHKGKIKQLQFGNEWQTQWWYAGSAEEFRTTQNLFYSTVKSVDPDIQVVLGGFSIGVLRYLAASQGLLQRFRDDDGQWLNTEQIQAVLNSEKAEQILNRIDHVLTHAYYDAIDIHLYDDPENWQHYLHAIKQKAPGIPVVISEFGGPNTQWESYSDTLHAQELVRYINAIDALDVEYALYFQLLEDDNVFHEKSGLISTKLKNKPAYKVFKTLNSAR